jgi:hypothetical protein
MAELEKELKEEEAELKRLLAQTEKEIVKFTDMLKHLISKEVDIEENFKKAGLHPVPVKLTPHEERTESLRADIESHLMELHKFKNYLMKKLARIQQEERTVEFLKKRYGRKAKIVKHDGEFEVCFSDKDTIKTYEALQKSRELLRSVKAKISEDKDLIE